MLFVNLNHKSELIYDFLRHKYSFMVGKIVLAITLNHKTGFISDKMPDKFRFVVMRTLPTASIFAAKRENVNIKNTELF